MSPSTTILDAAPPRTPPRSRARRVGEVIACSLAITTLAAFAGLTIALATDVRFGYAFVIARWICIFTLILVAFVSQVTERAGLAWRAPWVLRTPATVLLLTIESIAFDIVSAQLG